MRKYEQKQSGNLTEVICNGCGKAFKLGNGYLKEECICVNHVFGYFSKKDGCRHQFDLCENCYDKIIAQFQVPVTEGREKEFL